MIRLPVDNRIIIDELLIESVGELDERYAHDVAERISQGLARALRIFQEERLRRIRAGRESPQVIHVDRLQVRLRGMAAREPRVSKIVDALVQSFRARLEETWSQ